jgi:two-component system sensor histidine kinase/response regulator
VLAARIRERGGKVFEASTPGEITAAIERPELRFQIAIIGTISPLQTALDSASAVAANLAGRQTRVLCLVPADVEVTPPTLAQAGLFGCLTLPLRHAQLTDALNGAAGHPISEYASDQSVSHVEMSATRILVADDHEVNQLLVVDMLEQAGLRCDAVSDGAQAVKQAASGNYDVILMDCQMPVMDGFDAVRAIRARERAAGSAGKRTRIVALTANVNEGDRQRCIEAGMDDYCGKPIQRDQLLKAIRGSLKPAAIQHPAVTNAAAQKSLDLETVLHRCSDKPDLAQKVLGKLSSRAKESLEKIENSFAAADAAGVARIAHGLKGAAGMAAAATLEAVAGQLEQIARAGDLSLATEVLSSLQAEVLRCNQFVDQALKELSVMDRAKIRVGGRRSKAKEYDDADNNC